MCCCLGITSCAGASCGYCSECVGNAACNTTLDSSCLTGAISSPPVCTPTPGSGTDIASNTTTSCDPIKCVSACLPFAGVDANGNEIYQNPDGSLVYSDGSPATQADIAYNCGACKGTPCSPTTCGATTPPPKGNSCTGGPRGGGSGSGSAGGAGAKTPANASCGLISKLAKLVGGVGTTIGGILSGGTPVRTGTVLACGRQPAVLSGTGLQSPILGLSSNTYLLIILVVGALLLIMAFGHKPEGD